MIEEKRIRWMHVSRYGKISPEHSRCNTAKFLKLLLALVLFIEGLHNYLFHYETLSKSDLTVSVRQQRDVDTRHVTTRTYVSFFTLGRNFNLALKPGSPVLGPGLRAYTVDKLGNQTPLAIDPSNFLTGHLQENESILVDAHYENSILCVTIHFPNETYFTEPSWRHLPRSSEHDLISYRLADVNWSSMGYLPPPLKLLQQPMLSNSSARVNGQYSTFSKGKYRRKVSGGKKTCPLRLVADYNFYKDYSGGLAQVAVFTMLDAVHQADKIFRSTQWKLPDSFGWGLVVKELLVHTEYSNGPDCGVLSYNYRQDWTALKKIEAFSLDDIIMNFCLAHLFTSYSFRYDGGTVGLAFIGNKDKAGGICSKTMMTGGFGLDMFPRTGWTSTVNHLGDYLLRVEHHLAFTHETGHNWGSPHDPEGPCAPLDEHGGQHIMYPYTLKAGHPNNFLFSSCSIDSISTALEAVSADCFIESTEEPISCGNGIVDEKEDCDAGVRGRSGHDRCCSSICTFKENAICSNFNNGCCKDCKMAPAGVSCRTNSSVRCLQAVPCDGFSLTCPPPVPAVDGTPCVDGGTCKRGACISYCKALGESLNLKYKACMCQQDATAACKRCCMEVFESNTNGPCLPTNLTLGAGQRCYNGECNEKGECIPLEGTFVIKLSDFFHHLDINYVALFMKTNIVGTILILSTLIWIPASCYISYIDRKNLQRLQRRIADLQEMYGARKEDSETAEQNPHEELDEREKAATMDGDASVDAQVETVEIGDTM